MRAPLCLLAVLAACDAAGPAQRCEREGDAAECLIAAREKVSAGDRDLALFYFNHACRLGTAAGCDESRDLLRAELDRACTGGDPAACAARDAPPPGAPVAGEAPAPAPAADLRPWFYPEGFPWLDGAIIHDRYSHLPRITFRTPRPAIAARLTVAATGAGWTAEPPRTGPTGTLLAFTRAERHVALRLQDDGSGTSLMVISDRAQGRGGGVE